ncbi:hypothetical protein EVA_10559 [gut metagenome]|uniref:Uncharacterized protein n=1 Tax=gut metagenome TaxID=749906 RepID=J9G3B0_9ZZZZ
MHKAVGVQVPASLEDTRDVHSTDAVKEGTAYFMASIHEREAELQVGSIVCLHLIRTNIVK